MLGPRTWTDSFDNIWEQETEENIWTKREEVSRWWRQYVPPKRRYLPTSPYGVTTQKTNIDNFTTYFYEINFNIIPPLTPFSPKWSLQVSGLKFCMHFIFFSCLLQNPSTPKLSFKRRNTITLRLGPTMYNPLYYIIFFIFMLLPLS
jgi:hypothetical protein